MPDLYARTLGDCVCVCLCVSALGLGCRHGREGGRGVTSILITCFNPFRAQCLQFFF